MYIVKSKTYSEKCCKFLNIENYFVLKGIIIEVALGLLPKARYKALKLHQKSLKNEITLIKAKNVKNESSEFVISNFLFSEKLGHFIRLMKINFS